MSDSLELTKRELIQQEALTASVSHYRCGLGISMGVGKTLIGLRHMEKEFPNLKTRFLVVAPKVSIFESWKDDAKKFGLEYLLDHIDFTTYISLSKKTRDYDAYEKYLKVNQLEKLVNFCADNIVARAQKQAKVDKVKIFDKMKEDGFDIA